MILSKFLTGIRKKEAKFVNVFRFLLSFLLFIHFSIVALTVCPDNPITHIHKIALHAYVDPFFTQNWSLFAPNPVSTNQTLQVRFVSYAKGDSVQTEWSDLKESLIKQRAKDFWSPLQRLEKYLGGVTQGIVKDQIEINKYIANHPTMSKDSLDPIQNIFKANFAHRALVNYSKIVYKKMYAGPIQFDSVYLSYRVVDAQFPRFSKRHLNYYDNKNYKITYFGLNLGRIF